MSRVLLALGLFVSVLVPLLVAGVAVNAALQSGDTSSGQREAPPPAPRSAAASPAFLPPSSPRAAPRLSSSELAVPAYATKYDLWLGIFTVRANGLLAASESDWEAYWQGDLAVSVMFDAAVDALVSCARTFEEQVGRPPRSLPELTPAYTLTLEACGKYTSAGRIVDSGLKGMRGLSARDVERASRLLDEGQRILTDELPRALGES